MKEVSENFFVGDEADCTQTSGMAVVHAGKHPALQMNLGRDFRAWFLEGKYLPDNFDENTVYCMMILTKKEAKSLTKKITDPVSFLQSGL
jgi:hypothetical protein